MGIEDKIRFITDKVLSYYPEVEALTFKNKPKYRQSDYVEVTQVSMAICKQLLPGASKTTIGLYVRNKDHATVIHALKQVKIHCETEKSYREKYNRMLSEIGQEPKLFCSLAEMDSNEKCIEYLTAKHENGSDILSETIIMLIENYKSKSNGSN